MFRVEVGLNFIKPLTFLLIPSDTAISKDLDDAVMLFYDKNMCTNKILIIHHRTS